MKTSHRATADYFRLTHHQVMMSTMEIKICR